MSDKEQDSLKSAKKLGVFDSGLGGLTVLKELLRTHPDKDYIYFGDTAHVPYGSRDADDVISLVTDIARHLVQEGCEGLILACNTSSALALSALRTTVDVPIIGVIGAAAEVAASSNRGKISVLANPLTAASGVYRRSIETESKILGKDAPAVCEIGCPDLVDIVEKELLYTPESRVVLEAYAVRIWEFGADTLVLGCTHYPLLLPVLKTLLPIEIQIVNPAELIPEFLSESDKSKKGSVEYQVSGETASFNESASRILGHTIEARRVTPGKELGLSRK